MIIYVLAAMPALIWIHLLIGRGGFWRVRELSPTLPAPPSRRVVAIIPARDEADVIGDTVTSLLQQQYDGPMHLIVIDDGSRDGTAEVARAAAARLRAEQSLTVVPGQPLPSGWTGKLWAMAQGVERALAMNADYLLFTDADIHHEPGNLASLVARAESQHRDLVSYMVRLATVSTAEKWLIPAFVFFFFMLYPPSWVARPGSRTAAAAGGCVLIRPQALARIGGLQCIAGQIIDDCALAAAVKNSGGAVWLGLTRTAHSTRSYGSSTQIGHMIARTAFNQLRHSSWLLLGTLAGLFLTYLLPPLLVLFAGGSLAVLGGVAWLLMSLAYLPMLRFYRRSALWSITLPGIAAFYCAATLYSAVQYWRGRGGQWKGRAQDRA